MMQANPVIVKEILATIAAMGKKSTTKLLFYYKEVSTYTYS